MVVTTKGGKRSQEIHNPIIIDNNEQQHISNTIRAYDTNTKTGHIGCDVDKVVRNKQTSVESHHTEEP